MDSMMETEAFRGTYPGCLDCLKRLARTAAHMASPDQAARDLAEREALAVLESSLALERSSPELAGRMLRVVRRVTGTFDPYRDYKAHEMAVAQDAFDRLAPRLKGGLGEALALAALGNALDFFLPAAEIQAAAELFHQGQLRLFHDDGLRLAAFLAEKPRTVLYLADNSGEILFDRPLFDHLAAHAARMTLVVKSGPVFNDLTRADLDRAGLGDRFGPVAETGSDGPGLDWDFISDEFRELLDRADLILAKGLGHFETMIRRAPARPVFHVFKAKCEPTQAHLNAPAGAYFALWRAGREG
jgi:hypothetical protein